MNTQESQTPLTLPERNDSSNDISEQNDPNEVTEMKLEKNESVELPKLESQFLSHVIEKGKPDSFYSWLIAVAAFCANFISLGLVYSFGVLVVPLQNEFNAGRGIIAMIGSLSIGVALIFSTPSGLIADRHGYHLTIGIGSALIAIGLITSSFVPNYQLMFLTFGVITGIGMSLSFVPAVGSVGQWFNKRRGIAIGLAVAGSGMGNFVLPPLVNAVIQNSGWRNSMRVLAALVVFDIFAAIVIKKRISTVSKKFSVDGVYKTRPYIFLFLSAFFLGYGVFIPFAHIVPFAIDQGISPTSASILLSIMGAASIIGRLLLGVFADKFGTLLLLRVCFFFLGIFPIMWIFSTSFGLLATFGFFYGFFAGGFISLLPSVLAQYYGVEKISGIVGILYPAAAIGNTIGPYLTGNMYETYGNYTIAIIIMTVISMIGFVMLLFLPNAKKYKEKRDERKKQKLLQKLTQTQLIVEEKTKEKEGAKDNKKDENEEKDKKDKKDASEESEINPRVEEKKEISSENKETEEEKIEND